MQRRLGRVLIVGLAASCSAQAQPGVQRVGVYQIERQRVSGEQSVVVPGQRLDRHVEMLVTVGTDGRVIETQAMKGFGEWLDPAPALALARGWRFRPQTFDGAPVEAVGTIDITYTVPEEPTRDVPAPAFDPASASITLERGACFGACPAYKVTVTGAGAVRFATEHPGDLGVNKVHLRYSGNGVLWPGTHTAQIDTIAARALIERVRAIGFFGLKDNYACGVTD